MAQIIGQIPEFTNDETVQEEVKEVALEPETETPEPSPEKPAEQEIVGEVPDLSEHEIAIKALQDERVKLLKDIRELRGERREIKQEQVARVEKQIDELKDVHPQDVELIDKVLRSKGYMTKDEAQQVTYEAVKNDELAKFLDKRPEYKPENDPGNVNWDTLVREFGLYRTPSDPRQIGELLERAHKAVPKVPGTRALPDQKRRVEIASAGGGGTQKSSSSKSFTPDQRAALQGFTDEEIKKMEERL